MYYILTFLLLIASENVNVSLTENGHLISTKKSSLIIPSVLIYKKIIISILFEIINAYHEKL